MRRLIVSGVIAVVAPYAIANAQAMTTSAPAATHEKARNAGGVTGQGVNATLGVD